MIISHKIFKKPVYDIGKATTLRDNMLYLNSLMYPVKLKWASSVMQYNRVSKEAYINRFILKERQDIRTEEGKEDKKYKTDEEIYGEYKVSDLVKTKVDQYIQEYKDRNFISTVNSLNDLDKSYIANSLIKEITNKPEFINAHQSAFSDAILKGAGVIRNRLYDIDKTIQNVKVVKDALSYKEAKGGKKGLEIEYVDVENVILNPNETNLQDLYISTPYTRNEIISLFPGIKPYIFNNITNTNLYFENGKLVDNTANIPNIDSQSKNENPAVIMPEWLPYYKLGEKFVDWYKMPETMYNMTSTLNSMDSAFDYGFDLPSGVNRDNGFDFTTKNSVQFNQMWSNLYFGNAYNTMLGKLTKAYRVNEYYNWAEDYYCIFIGNYIIYEGAMLEPHKECPITPIYFKHDEQHGFFGKTLCEEILPDQITASELLTKYNESFNISRSGIFVVDSGGLEDGGNNSIEIEPFTVIRSKISQSQDGTPSNQPVIQQIPIKIPALELGIQMEDRVKMNVEKLFPDTKSINMQISKEERQNDIFARDLVVSNFLTINANQLSKFALKTYSCKLFELSYFDNKETIIKLPNNNKVGLVMRDTEIDIQKAKQEIQKAIQDNYEKQSNIVLANLLQDPNNQQIVEQTQQQIAQQIQEKVGSDPNNVPPNIEEIQQKATADALKQTFQQQIEEMIGKMPEDKNWYIIKTDLSNSIKISNSIQFRFDKSKMEKQQESTQIMSFLAASQFSGFAFDWKNLALQIIEAYDMNPNLVASEVAPATTLSTMNSTKMAGYIDPKNDPVGFSKLMKIMYGIDSTFEENNPMVQQNMFMAKFNSDLKIQEKIATKAAEQQGSGAVKELDHTQKLAQMEKQQEIDQQNQEKPNNQ